MGIRIEIEGTERTSTRCCVESANRRLDGCDRLVRKSEQLKKNIKNRADNCWFGHENQEKRGRKAWIKLTQNRYGG